MKTICRSLFLICLTVALGIAWSQVPAFAASAPTKHHVKKYRKTASRGRAMVREAQVHLQNLGYYTIKVDGINGPKTKEAVKAFQREHQLKATGVLTALTYKAIIDADKTQAMTSLPIQHTAPVTDFVQTHPDFYGHYDRQYADPMMVARQGGAVGGAIAQDVFSRYAKVDVTEDTNGGMKRYNISLNGQPLLQAENQPSVIGISRTYTLDNEDAIIFSSYNSGDSVCAYKHYLLTMRDGGATNLQEIGNCTRGYQANVANDALFVTFPEDDDGRSVGNIWRYDHGDLERL